MARLHLLPEFRAALAEAVPGGHGVRYQLHPPVLRALGMRRKLALPAPVARPAFGVLRAMRHVRGTPADVFGYSRVRRTERRLAAEYEDGLRAVLPGLDAGPARRHGGAGPAAAGHPRLRAHQAGGHSAVRRGPGEAARRAGRAR